MPHYFKLSTIAILVSLNTFAYAAENPHSIIQLTPEVVKQYTGKNVPIGVIDSSFVLSHPNLAGAPITPVPFSVQNNINGETENFDPNEDILETEEDENGEESTIYSQHGSSVAGIITARPMDNTYLGGVAQGAQLYIAATEPYNPSDSAGDEEGVSFILDDTPSAQNQRNRFAKAFELISSKKVLAINNSWNEDPFGDSAQEMDNVYADLSHTNNNFIDAIKNTAKNDILMVFAAGNESKKQPGIMAAFPRYLPELEKHFLSVVAAKEDHTLEDYSNYCGVSKNWCIAAPGSFNIVWTDYNDDEKSYVLRHEEGTSLAAPVITGSLAILKERFDYMKPTQIRDTLLTTATDLGDKGVDEKFGWGLANITKALNGPAQLLNDEDYQVSRDDTWSNDLNTNNYKFTKSGAGALNLAGNNTLNVVDITQGRLNLTGKTTALQINNRAQLGVSANLQGQIQGEQNSTTYFGTNAHWIMPASTSLGNVEMESGSKITLNPSHSAASGQKNAISYNTLTITNNLSGNGQFNFLTNLGNWQGDKVIVEGVATGNFKLAVENTGQEPTSVEQLNLMHLRNANQSDAVNVSLVNPVDLGAYRYELRNSNYNFNLHNPRKEKELEEARLAEIERQRQEAERQRLEAEEAERQRLAAIEAERQRLEAEEAERQRLAAEAERKRQEAEEAERQRLAAEAERKRQEAEEAERQRLAAEAERKRQEAEEAERQRLAAEAERKRQEAEEAERQRLVTIEAEKAKAKENNRKQAELISRYSNAALSDLSAQVNGLMNIGRSLDQRHFTKVEKLNVWSNVENEQYTRASDYYRAYKQRSQLTELGVQLALNETIDVGAVVSQASSKVNYDHQGSGKNRLYSLTTFAKAHFENGIVARTELGIGKAKSRLEVDSNTAEFSRNSFNAGLHLGYDWQVAGFNLQPNVGVRYWKIDGMNYRLNQAQIQSNALNLWAYQAGLKAEKRIDFGSWALTPSLASYYVDTANKTQTVRVNNAELTQAFGRHFSHELALATKWRNWEVAIKAGLKTGNELHRQHHWGVNFGYNW